MESDFPRSFVSIRLGFQSWFLFDPDCEVRIGRIRFVARPGGREGKGRDGKGKRPIKGKKEEKREKRITLDRDQS